MSVADRHGLLVPTLERVREHLKAGGCRAMVPAPPGAPRTLGMVGVLGLCGEKAAPGRSRCHHHSACTWPGRCQHPTHYGPGLEGGPEVPCGGRPEPGLRYCALHREYARRRAEAGLMIPCAAAGCDKHAGPGGDGYCVSCKHDLNDLGRAGVRGLTPAEPGGPCAEQAELLILDCIGQPAVPEHSPQAGPPGLETAKATPTAAQAGPGAGEPPDQATRAAEPSWGLPEPAPQAGLCQWQHCSSEGLSTCGRRVKPLLPGASPHPLLAAFPWCERHCVYFEAFLNLGGFAGHSAQLVNALLTADRPDCRVSFHLHGWSPHSWQARLRHGPASFKGDGTTIQRALEALASDLAANLAAAVQLLDKGAKGALGALCKQAPHFAAALEKLKPYGIEPLKPPHPCQ